MSDAKSKKKASKKKVTKSKAMPLNMLPFTSDSRDSLNNLVFMAESIIYHWFLANFDGDIGKIHAFIVKTEDLEAVHKLPEVVEYVKQVKSFGKKFAIQIDVEVYPRETEEENSDKGDIDEL